MLKGASPNLANRARGEYGERRAGEWYEQHGGVVIDRNWRDGRRGEIDLVVDMAGTIVFCEVKARRSAEFGHPAEAITPTKQARMGRNAAAWMAAHPALGRRRYRFDLVCVLGTDVEVFHDVLC